MTNVAAFHGPVLPCLLYRDYMLGEKGQLHRKNAANKDYNNQSTPGSGLAVHCDALKPVHTHSSCSGICSI